LASAEIDESLSFRRLAILRVVAAQVAAVEWGSGCAWFLVVGHGRGARQRRARTRQNVFVAAAPASVE